MFSQFVVLLCSPLALASNKNIAVKDDSGQLVTLTEPAMRIVALGPNLVESLYAIGVGNRLIGVSAYSDFPAEASALAVVGSHNTVNYERIVQLNPDLIVVWQSGFGQAVIDKLLALGFSVYVSEPQSLSDVALLLRELGKLTGVEDRAESEASRYQAQLDELALNYSDRPAVRVFYQVWDEPMQTLNGDHVVSSVINLCGGVNVFAELGIIAPRVSVESVLASRPDVIIASGADGIRPTWLDDWQQWPTLNAVKRKHLYFVEPSVLVRHAPRIVDGAIRVCELLDRVRTGHSSEGVAL
jgi:iron complex transport system substrate-binding protein